MAMAIASMALASFANDALGQPEAQPAQSATAAKGGTAIVAGRDVNIYRDPEVLKLMATLLEQQRRTNAALLALETQRKRRDEDFNRLREELLSSTVADVVKANRQPQPSASAVAAKRGLEAGQTEPSVTYYEEIERASAKEGRDKLRLAADAARNLGNLAFLHDTKKALDSYRRATEYDPENLWGWLHYGDLLVRAGDSSASLQAYARAQSLAEQRLAKDAADLQARHDLVWVQLKIGDSIAARGRTTTAAQSYNRALELAKQLVAGAPQDALLQGALSVSYGRVGDILTTTGDHALAADAYAKAVDIAQRRLANKSAADSELQSSLASIYMKLGNQQAARGSTASAFVTYEMALTLRKKLATNDSGNPKWQRDLAANYRALGMLHLRKPALEPAQDALRKSLEIVMELAEADPADTQLQRDLALTYESVGDWYVALAADRVHDVGSSLLAFEDAYTATFELRSKLIKIDSDNAQWQRDLSRTYRRFGASLQTLGEPRAAKVEILKALDLSRKLATADPANVPLQFDVIDCVMWLTSSRRGDKTTGEEKATLIDSAIEILRRLEADGRLTAAQSDVAAVLKDRKSQLQRGS